MKATKFLALALCFAALATSCRKDVETPAPEGKKISVSAQMYNFTKATDTAFEEGDQIGLHILTNTTWLDNAKYTYTGGLLVGEQTNLWYTDEDVVADVVAYYPYNASANYNAAGYTFTVNADQSSAKAYTASDLMVAATTSAPTAEAVKLPFRHVLSKVVIGVDNQLGEDIANVWFSGVYGTATVNLLDGTSATSGSKGTIKAASVTVDGSKAWALILAPQQSVTPQLIVTTVSNKQYTFSLAEAVSFAAGKVSTAEVALTKESIATSFTPTISDWEADNELQFSQSEDEGDIDTPFVAEESGLGVVGSFAASGWATDAILYTTPITGLYVAEDVAFVAGDSFKIRTAGSWEGKNIGRNANAVNYIKANHYIAVENDGNSANIAIEADGTYDIYFNENAMVVYVMAADADYTTAVEQTVSGEEPVTEEPEVTENMLYLLPNSEWMTDSPRFAAYFFGDGINAWVSMVDSDSDGIYEVNIPVGAYTTVIFCRMNPATTANNWDNKWNQTSDLVIPTDGTNLYTLNAGSWDAGVWSTK